MAELDLVLIEDTDPYVKKLMDAKTGQEYFVKTAKDEAEVEDYRAASVFVVPDLFSDVLAIPKLISEDRALLPEELQDMEGPIMIMEAAQGQDMMLAEHSIFGAQPITIYESDWRNFIASVAHMNAQGIIHGDIGNTSNIFANQDDQGFTRFELIDWGGPHKGKPDSDLPELLAVEKRLREKGFIVEDPADAKFNRHSRGQRADMATADPKVRVLRNKEGQPVRLGSVHL